MNDDIKKAYADRLRKPTPVIERSCSYYKATRDKYRASVILSGAKRRAVAKGLPFNLSPADIAIPDVCPVFGFPLLVRKGSQGPAYNSPSVDRIDNSRGYVRGNVIVVSWLANSIKGAATVEQIRRVADFYEALGPAKYAPCEF